MKTKVLTLIALAAIVTLSFTFTSKNPTQKKADSSASIRSNDSEPIGGFASDEK